MTLNCIKYFIPLFYILLFCGFTTPIKAKKSPNIIIVFIDDLGYGDLSCTGAINYSTPNIDKLAAKGMQFTRFYAAQAVCSASRAGLLTGCYPNRIGINGALNPHAKIGLNPNEETIAEMLKKRGYKTAAIGKWHLGHHKEFLPLQHGFDEYVGVPYSNDMWPLSNTGEKLPAKNNRNTYPDLPVMKDIWRFAGAAVWIAFRSRCVLWPGL